MTTIFQPFSNPPQIDVDGECPIENMPDGAYFSVPLGDDRLRVINRVRSRISNHNRRHTDKFFRTSDHGTFLTVRRVDDERQKFDSRRKRRKASIKKMIGSPQFLRSVRKDFRYEPGTGILSKRNEQDGNRYDPVVTKTDRGYISVNYAGTTFLAHRIAWLIVTGRWPRSDITHINNNLADNRWQNLSDSQDCRPRPSGKTRAGKSARVRGVSYCATSKKFKAYIGVRGKTVHLGSFKKQKDAIAARLRAEKNIKANGK